ncbi:1-acyl-sn-glycerol-3-phosphate acyltransferase [Desulfocicer niacini]
MSSFLSMCGKLIYHLMGWTYDGLPSYWAKKSVVIGFPHTANMDTVRALTYIKICRINAKLLVKADWFFWPMSILLKNLGGVPVHRNKAHGFVASIAEEYHKNDEFVLALVPEGTRKKTRRIRTGFWNIARAAQVPVICWFLDNKNRKTCWVGQIIPSDDLKGDLLKINALYQAHGYELPLGDMDQYQSKKN